MTRAAALSFLAPRCDEEGSCLIWRRAVNSGGSPVASIDGKSSRSVRRWVFERLHGPAGADMAVVPTCDNPLCVEPRHAEAVTRSMVNVLIADRGGMRTPAARRARRINGRTQSPLTIEDVRAIRRRKAGGETLVSMRADYPVSLAVLSKICRHESWPDPAANPFSGMMPA